MFGEEKNIKSVSSGKGLPALKDTTTYISYNKSDKLITALYMVTDIIDVLEPIRNKLRTLGAGILSDIYQNPLNATQKIAELMSFLDLASSVNIISAMNAGILRKEFSELYKSIEEFSLNKPQNKPIDLIDFLRNEEVVTSTQKDTKEKPKTFSQIKSNSIGVQKGSTLLKALSDKNFVSSVSMINMSDRIKSTRSEKKEAFSLEKNNRHEDIINIIKIIGGSATIKDIKDKIKAMPEYSGSLASCGEKTLQRELVSMVRDGVLNKAGEKRWSRYSLSKRGV